MTVNGKGQYRLEDVLADSSNGERKQIMRYMGVKAVNGTKLHYKQNVPAKSAVNEEVENESGDENVFVGPDDEDSQEEEEDEGLKKRDT